MKLSNHIRLWNHVSIKVMDVRHIMMGPGEDLQSYRLPASAFLYAVRGSAQVWLDRNEHTAKRFHVLHGGKGLCLDILGLPLLRRRFDILSKKARRYSVNEIENHYRYKGEVNISMYRSMRQTAMTAFLCLTLLLGACSNTGTNGGAQSTGGNAETQTNAAKNTDGPKESQQPKSRIVSTPKGDVEVPAEPKKVASDQYMGQLLKLGIVPIGVRDGMLKESWIEKAGISKDTLSKIESLGGFPLNAEKLISLEPDLIIGSIEANIEQYQKIGTTVFVPYWEKIQRPVPLINSVKSAKFSGSRRKRSSGLLNLKRKWRMPKNKSKAS